MQDCGQNWYCNQFQMTVERCIPSPLTRGCQIGCRIQYFFLSDTSVSAAVVTRAELATRMRNTTDSVIGRSVEGGASEQNTT